MTAGGVVHVITGLEIGGAEMLLLELCREETRRGRRFSVASLISDGPMRARFAQSGIDVLGLGMKRGEFFAPGLVNLVRLIRRVRPRIVQGWLYHGNLGAAAATWLSGVVPRPRLAWGILGALPDFVATRRGAPGRQRRHKALPVCRRHSLQQPRRPRRAPRIRLPRPADATGFERDRFDEISLRPRSRAATRLALGLPADAIVVIAVGRNDPMKNWPGMLAATEAAGDRNIWLVAIGEGSERLPPGPRRRLLGRRDDMPALYSAADIFMLASHFGEGTSVALGEAMACGLPVIVTEVGDNGAIARDAGFVVPPRDAAALAEALVILADDPALRARAGKAAQERATARFGVDWLHAGFCSFYDALLGEPFICGGQEAV